MKFALVATIAALTISAETEQPQDELEIQTPEDVEALMVDMEEAAEKMSSEDRKKAKKGCRKMNKGYQRVVGLMRNPLYKSMRP